MVFVDDDSLLSSANQKLVDSVRDQQKLSKIQPPPPTEGDHEMA